MDLSDLQKELEDINSRGESVAKEMQNTALHMDYLKSEANKISGEASLISRLIKKEKERAEHKTEETAQKEQKKSTEVKTVESADN